MNDLKKFLGMELARACRNGDIEECRRIWEDTEPPAGEMSNLHWLLLSSGTLDTDCLAILDLFGVSQINYAANDVALSGFSRIDKVSSVRPLHLAVLYKSAAVVSKLLGMGANPDLQDSNGETCLMYACRDGLVAKVSVLLDSGADITITSLSGDSATSLTSDSSIRFILQSRIDEQLIKNLRHNEDVEPLLRVKANVNAVHSDYGFSPMSYAVSVGDYELILRFLESGGEVQNGDLHAIIGSSNLVIEQKIELLAEFIYMKADVNYRNSDGKTAIELLDKSDAKISKLLIDNGAIKPEEEDLVSQDHYEEPESVGSAELTASARSSSVQFTQSAAARTGLSTVDLSELASRAGALIAELAMASRFVGSIKTMAPEVSESTLIDFQKELTQSLSELESKFAILKSDNLHDFKSIGKFMELQKQIADKRAELVSIKRRIDIKDYSLDESAQASAQASALASAHASSSMTPAESLEGSFPEKKSGWFRSPDSIEADLENCVRAIRKSTGNIINVNSAIFEFLQSGGAVYHPQSVQILKLLRNRGSEINFASPEGLTGLMLVCDSSVEEPDLVDFMLTNSANVHAVENRRGWTALHFAVSRSNLHNCKQLLKRGALGQVEDKEGKVAIDYCRNPAIKHLVGDQVSPALVSA